MLVLQNVLLYTFYFSLLLQLLFLIPSLFWFCNRANFRWLHGRISIVFEILPTSFTQTVRPRMHFASLSSLKLEVWPLILHLHISFKYQTIAQVYVVYVVVFQFQTRLFLSASFWYQASYNYFIYLANFQIIHIILGNFPWEAYFSHLFFRKCSLYKIIVRLSDCDSNWNIPIMFMKWKKANW